MKLEIVAEKIVRTDSISIEINYVKKQAARKPMFMSLGRKSISTEYESGMLKLIVQVKALGRRK